MGRKKIDRRRLALVEEQLQSLADRPPARAQYSSRRRQDPDESDPLSGLRRTESYQAVTGGLKKVVGAPFKIIGDLLSLAGSLGRTPTGYAKRLGEQLEGKARGSRERVTLKEEDLAHLLGDLEGMGEPEVLHPRRKGRGKVTVSTGELLQALTYIKKGGLHKDREHYVQIAAAFLFLATSIIFLDQATITGYAVSQATGTSLGGYYSLIGLAFLGIAVLSFAWQDRKR